MRAPRVFLASLFLLSIAACGGGVAGVSDAGASDDSGGARDATADGAGIRDASDLSCDVLLRRIDELRAATRECCAECRVPQCTQQVDDLCCPLSVTTPNAEFAGAVAEYKRRCPGVACPAVPCRLKPSYQCDPGTTAGKGTCAL